MARDFDRRAQNTEGHLRRSVTAARSLTFAASGLTGKLDNAAEAAGVLAENLAKSAKNAKLAAGATGVGALLVVGAALFSIFKESTQQMVEFNNALNKLGNQTALANLHGFGPAGDARAKREEIRQSGQDEIAQIQKLVEAKKINTAEEKALTVAVYARVKAETDAFNREIAYERNRAFGVAEREGARGNELSALMVASHHLGPLGKAYTIGGKQAELAKREALDQLKLDAEDKQYTEEQVKALTAQIEAQYRSQMGILKNDLADMANEVGQTFVESLSSAIADGISAAIQSGNIGDGFKALTGGILIGLGEMMQRVGTESLLAAKLMTQIVAALRNFAPEGAIGPALLLIAAGGVLKGIGASMGGRSRGGGSSGAYGSGSSLPQIVDRGLVNPLNPLPSAVGLRALQSVSFPGAIFIGTDDARAQSQMIRMIEKGLARSGRRL